MVILAAWLSRKITSPWLAALLVLVLIGVAIYGLIENDMPTLIAIIIMVIGVINIMRLLPRSDVAADAHLAAE